MNSKKRFVLFIAFIVVSILVSIFSGYFSLNIPSIQSFVSTNHVLVAFLFTFLFIVLTSFAFSVTVMTSIGVLFFSVPEAITYAMIGITGSFIIDFFISRKLGKDYVKKYIEKRGGKLEEFENILEKNTFKTTFLLSAIFFVPSTIPNLLGGIMDMKFKDYFIASFLGRLPNTIFTVYFINGLLYSNSYQIYGSIAVLILTSLVSLYFYNGEIKHIMRIAFPWMFRKK